MEVHIPEENFRRDLKSERPSVFPICANPLLLSTIATALVILGGCDTFNTSGSLYSDKEIAYFREIALGSEYGKPPESGRIRKWTQPLHIDLSGDPSERHRAEVHRVMREVNGLTGGVADMRLCQNEVGPDGRFCPKGGAQLPNVRVRFILKEHYPDCTPNNADHTDAYFKTGWQGEGEIYTARICIGIFARSREKPPSRKKQARVAHLIREELTQILGLRQDSWEHPESIFYQNYSERTSYAEIDRVLIEMLYRPEIRPGMSREEATAVLRSLRE